MISTSYSSASMASAAVVESSNSGTVAVVIAWIRVPCVKNEYATRASRIRAVNNKSFKPLCSFRASPAIVLYLPSITEKNSVDDDGIEQVLSRRCAPCMQLLN